MDKTLWDHDMICAFKLQEGPASQHGFILSPGHLEFELFALAQHSQLACDGAFLLGARQLTGNSMHKAFAIHFKREVRVIQQFPQNSTASYFHIIPYPYQTSSNYEIPSTASSFFPTYPVSRPHWRSARGSWTPPGSRLGRWSGSPCRAWDPKTSAPWDGRNHTGGMMGDTLILFTGNGFQDPTNGKIHYNKMGKSTIMGYTLQ